MKKFIIVAILIVIICSIEVSGQNYQNELYTPLNVKKAFKNETRSQDGKPGKKYWQNRGRYDINLIINPPSRTIYGIEEITYFNNSRDTLKDLGFKLIVNIHRPGAVRYTNTDSLYLTPGIHVDSYSENNDVKVWKENPSNNTFQSMELIRPLLPHDSVRLSIKWHYDVSLKSNREGMIDSTTYFLAYFYPRIAVYDDYQGWDVSEFNDFLEFYNDFNDYKLNVHVPKNYLVWATGTLLNVEEVLQPVYADRLIHSMTSDGIIHIVTRADWSSQNITSPKSMNTWKWEVKNMTDVTLAVSNHFVWDASSVVVDSVTKRRASVQAAFSDTAVDFHSMVRYGRFALDWFSNNWPGIPYPYEKTTIFQGFAGMEYPMMVNDESSTDTITSKWVAWHEISHTYMPFYMGINETLYGFMDEGWATTFESLINAAGLGVEKAEELKAFRLGWWIQNKVPGSQLAHDYSLDFNLPIINSANNSFFGYAVNEYSKPALAYLALKEMLGDEKFKKCLHEYMERWNGKHPLPWDFFYSFNSSSDQNLNWFWNNWFFSYYYPDLGIGKVNKSTAGYTISIDNIGGMAVSVTLNILYADNSKDVIHKTPAVWKDNQKVAVIIVKTSKVIKSLKLDSIFDADDSNNFWGNK